MCFHCEVQHLSLLLRDITRQVIGPMQVQVSERVFYQRNTQNFPSSTATTSGAVLEGRVCTETVGTLLVIINIAAAMSVMNT